MINIEIHGLGLHIAPRTRQEIIKIFSADEIKVSIFDHQVIDANQKEVSFLRVYATSRENSEKIREKLLALDMDIEYISLDSYWHTFPRKK